MFTPISSPSFNNQKLRNFPTDGRPVYVFCVIQTINKEYFPMQHYTIAHFNGYSIFWEVETDFVNHRSNESGNLQSRKFRLPL
jgi:hypothetical protein